MVKDEPSSLDSFVSTVAQVNGNTNQANGSQPGTPVVSQPSGNSFAQQSPDSHILYRATCINGNNQTNPSIVCSCFKCYQADKSQPKPEAETHGRNSNNTCVNCQKKPVIMVDQACQTLPLFADINGDYIAKEGQIRGSTISPSSASVRASEEEDEPIRKRPRMLPSASSQNTPIATSVVARSRRKQATPRRCIIENAVTTAPQVSVNNFDLSDFDADDKSFFRRPSRNSAVSARQKCKIQQAKRPKKDKKKKKKETKSLSHKMDIKDESDESTENQKPTSSMLSRRPDGICGSFQANGQLMILPPGIKRGRGRPPKSSYVLVKKEPLLESSQSNRNVDARRTRSSFGMEPAPVAEATAPLTAVVVKRPRGRPRKEIRISSPIRKRGRPRNNPECIVSKVIKLEKEPKSATKPEKTMWQINGPATE